MVLWSSRFKSVTSCNLNISKLRIDSLKIHMITFQDIVHCYSGATLVHRPSSSQNLGGSKMGVVGLPPAHPPLVAQCRPGSRCAGSVGVGGAGTVGGPTCPSLGLDGGGGEVRQVFPCQYLFIFKEIKNWIQIQIQNKKQIQMPLPQVAGSLTIEKLLEYNFEEERSLRYNNDPFPWRS